MADWLIVEAVRNSILSLWHDLLGEIASSSLWLRFCYIIRYNRSSQGEPQVKALSEDPRGCPTSHSFLSPFKV